MTTLIIDDEVLARNRIEKLLKKNERIDSVFLGSSGKDAIKMVDEIQPNIVFLDIQMTDMTGFDVLKKINCRGSLPVIIFVTAFDHFAAKAFEVQAFDFLLKPFKDERFFEVLERGIIKAKSEEKLIHPKISDLKNVIEYKEEPIALKPEPFLERVVLKKGNKYYFVKTSNIKYIVSSSYYAEIFMNTDEKHVYRISMSDFIKKLDPNNFIRVNRSSILKINEIKEIICEGMGDYSIVMNGNKTFVLTKNYKSDFLKILNIKK